MTVRKVAQVRCSSGMERDLYMGRFEALMHAWPGLQAGDQQRLAEREFPLVVQSSNFRYWRPSDEIPPGGRRFLIGAATYFVADVRLLDALDDVLSTQPESNRDRIDVFNVCDIQTREGLQDYFPGCALFGDVPFVGLWENGSMIEYAWGARGRDLVIRSYPSLNDVTFCDWWPPKGR